ncbi:MAG TPA: heme-binding domain-containing protein, partial [Kofleriaceae bacterium]|nr:heme-binding domain-containing protein [Kofleriaceae bacterium]
MRRLFKALLWTFGGLAILFGVAQIIPYGRTHDNPPTIQEPSWDSPRTRELAVRACFDCHSNQSRWPWYSNLAPFSWGLMFDVDTARTVLNFSE